MAPGHSNSHFAAYLSTARLHVGDPGDIVTSRIQLARLDFRLRFFGDAFANRGTPEAGSTMREAWRVSAFKNFFISRSAESFSLFVLETVQSEGTNNLKSRI